MQPATTNGNPSKAREALDTARQLVEKLEADLQKQSEEIKQLRAERDEARMMLKEMKRFIRDLPEWEKFNPDEYTVTTEDILADLRVM